MNLIRSFREEIDKNSIILLGVFRDEDILLEYFIKYYKKIGITHFIMIDNGSQDGSFEYLLNIDANIMLFQTFDSYSDSHFGTDWINHLLKKYCKNHWCLVVDIDELVYIDNINKLISNMKNENCHLCRFLLLDMYSKNNNKYKRGDDFLSHSNYFDKYNDTYLKYSRPYPRGTPQATARCGSRWEIYGGVRKRICNIRCCLMKNSLFFYNFFPIKLGNGYHCLIENQKELIIKEYSKLEFLLHFKFIKPNFNKFIETRIKNNQDWNNSSEYKAYENLNLNDIFDPKFSIKIKNKKKLNKQFKNIIN